MKISDIVAATGGTLVAGDARIEIERIGTDTRALNRGDGFVALHGANFDANDFLDEAVTAGAAVIVCARGRAPRTDRAAVVEVDDTLRALGDIAGAHRRSLKVRVVAVTGSNGKTTTKEMLRAVLAREYGDDAVLANAGNLNNLVGLPLTLMNLTAAHRVAITEMGMNARGEIARLAEIALPDVGVITCVGAAHLEGLGSIEGVAEAKGELFAGLPATATAVINCGDPLVAGQARRFAGRTLSFRVEGAEEDVRAENVEALSLDSMRFELVVGARRCPVTLPLGGRHNVSNALAAAACAVALGVGIEAVAAGLSAASPVPMRLSHESFANGVELIDDCYNANPSSLAAAMATMAETVAGRRMIVLGDMLELGERAELLHREAGVAAALLEPVLLCALGDFAQAVADGASEGGLGGDIVVAHSHEQAAEAVAERWRSGDTVLVKGSRGAGMEKVVDAMRRLSAK